MKIGKFLFLGLLVTAPVMADQVIAFGPGFGAEGKNSLLGEMPRDRLNRFSEENQNCAINKKKLLLGNPVPGSNSPSNGPSNSGVIASNRAQY